MTLEELKKLKSGTDLRGTAIAGSSPVTLTDEAVTLLTKAFCTFLKKKYSLERFKIAIGNDSRLSAERIYLKAKEAALYCGGDVVYTGLSSTPSMFILLKKIDPSFDASVMITASHLPYDRNGLKFFTKDGGLDGKDIDEIIEIAASGEFTRGDGNFSEKNYMGEYSRLLVNKIIADTGEKKPLAGKKIIVDAGNGAGGFFVPEVLEKLGADTEGSLFLQPDGAFPNHVPNPEDREAIACLSAQVKAKKADMGIIFDTDVDRAAIVDGDGGEINRNRLIALVSALLLEERPGVIVTDSVTSDGLRKFIEKRGGKQLRFKRGYKNVIDKCRELNDGGIYSPLAIETSGHAAFADNYYLDDGAYLIIRILTALSIQAKKGLTVRELICGLEEPLESDEIRISFNENSADFKAEGAQVVEFLKTEAARGCGFTLAKDNFEGARLDFGCGWTLVRMSVHDPVMPINMESVEAGGNLEMAKTLCSLLEGFRFLDITNLKKFISLRG